MITLLIATRNAHKVGEIRQMLGKGYTLLTLNEFLGAPEAVEDADTFAGNARKKSETLAHWLAENPKLQPKVNGFFYVMADDSGLEVDALNGAPGIYSARFSTLGTGGAGNSPDEDNNKKLLRLLKDIPPEKRTARFRCVLALTPLAPNAETKIVEGSCEGMITAAASGKGGFGYDPLFIPQGYSQSFSELGDVVKNKISHRSKALEQLKAVLKQ